VAIKAVVGFSFGLTKNEPNQCNIRLAREVERIAQREREKGNSVIIVTQWEVSFSLSSPFLPHFIIWEHRDARSYLDSDEVAGQATEFLRQQAEKMGEKINGVIPIANPFLHLALCRRLLKKKEWNVPQVKIRWIGFLPKSSQWFTRGPIRLIVYSFLRILHRFGQKAPP